MEMTINKHSFSTWAIEWNEPFYMFYELFKHVFEVRNHDEVVLLGYFSSSNSMTKYHIHRQLYEQHTGKLGLYIGHQYRIRGVVFSSREECELFKEHIEKITVWDMLRV